MSTLVSVTLSRFCQLTRGGAVLFLVAMLRQRRANSVYVSPGSGEVPCSVWRMASVRDMYVWSFLHIGPYPRMDDDSGVTWDHEAEE
jgi:hypothetical protein